MLRARSYRLTIGDGTIDCSYGIAVDEGGNIYASDSEVVRKYNASGTELGSWGPDGAGGSESFDFAEGLVYANNKIYVANWTNDASAKIFAFDTNGALVDSFGTGLFRSPGFINADSDGNIYVPDYTSNSIYKYSGSGTLLQTISDIPGVGSGVEGVGIDAQGFIYTTKSSAVDVQIAYPNGNFFTSFGSVGTGHGEFSTSESSLTFDAEGNLYVVDNDDDFRIQKFSAAALPSTWYISAGTQSLSYLSVAHSVAASPFTCTGCTDGGGNTNWIFAAADSGGGGGGGGGGGHSSSGHSTVIPISAVISGATTTTSGTPTLTQAQIQAIIDLLTSFGVDPAIIATVEDILRGTHAPVSGASPVFARDLEFGMDTDDVKALQVWLNTHGYLVALTGDGSIGLETAHFGPATKAAVIEFQLANGITPPQGYVGPKTRAVLANFTQ